MSYSSSSTMVSEDSSEDKYAIKGARKKMNSKIFGFLWLIMTMTWIHAQRRLLDSSFWSMSRKLGLHQAIDHLIY